MRFKFFHAPKPRQFDYIPRYYSPEKEEREERKKTVLGENYKDAYENEGEKKEYEPGQFVNQVRIRRGIIADRERVEKKRMRTLRALVFLILLIAIGYWLVVS